MSLRSLRRRMWLLPLVLGALALRVLMPGAGMPNAGMPMGYDSTLCSTSPDRGGVERFGAPADFSGTHCESCIAPLLGAPLAHWKLEGIPPLAERFIAQFDSQVSDSPLARTQRARAPPLG